MNSVNYMNTKLILISISPFFFNLVTSADTEKRKVGKYEEKESGKYEEKESGKYEEKERKWEICREKERKWEI